MADLKVSSENLIPDATSLGPVSAPERVHLLDVLRGFALFGVLLGNVITYFSGGLFLSREQQAQLPTAFVDTVTWHLYSFFVDSKFITIFALLFGLGFAIQLIRAEERGARVVPVYARRLFILFMIGMAHFFLLWFGDILWTYALMGFLLILFRRRKPRTLLVSGVILFVVVPSLMLTMRWYAMAVLGMAPPSATAGPGLTFEQRAVAAFSEGSYLEVLSMNIEVFATLALNPGFILLLSAILGRFLLGFYAGRRRLLQDAEKHVPFFRKLLMWGLTLGFLGNGLAVLVSILLQQKLVDRVSPWRLAADVFGQVGILMLSLAYIAAITLLFQRPGWRKRLSALAPIGRMALTNYLMQTLICIFIFYSVGFGFGLMGKVGPTVCVGISVAIFGVQIIISRWWLSRFQFGPMEWLWRSLTYGDFQPIRIQHPQQAAPDPVAL